MRGTPRAAHAEIDNRFWEPEDDWIEDHLHQLLDNHQAQLGYSTAVWHNVLTSDVLAEREAWFTSLKHRAQVPYPNGLVTAILSLNLPLLSGSLVAYPEQIRLAAAREDLVSIQHRVAALLASYFDVLFAINRVPHPGEKRLLASASKLQLTPQTLRDSVTALLDASNSDRVLTGIDTLPAGLEEVLKTSDQPDWIAARY